MHSRDTLVKVLAAVFLNPADRKGEGKKTFIQQFLGCGCPDAVVEQATVSFFTRPLGLLLEKRIETTAPSKGVTPLEQDVNRLLALPTALKWPRDGSGRPIAPTDWTRAAIQGVAGTSMTVAEKLTRLKAFCRAVIDGVIEVPGRAFFFLVVQDREKLSRRALKIQYETGQLLYQLMGYNRCRLFTICPADEPKRIPEIDTALTWQGISRAFDGARSSSPFLDDVLSLLNHRP